MRIPILFNNFEGFSEKKEEENSKDMNRSDDSSQLIVNEENVYCTPIRISEPKSSVFAFLENGKIKHREFYFSEKVEQARI